MMNPSADSSNVWVCTGFSIFVSICLVVVISKSQTKTALSTMEIKIVPWSHFCQDMFSAMDVVSLLGRTVNLPEPTTNVQVLVHEDNAGALILAEPNQSQEASIMLER